MTHITQLKQDMTAIKTYIFVNSALLVDHIILSADGRLNDTEIENFMKILRRPEKSLPYPL